MKVLIVYYSLSGTTRTLASALAKELVADSEEIHCARYTMGFFGVLRAIYDTWKGDLPSMGPLSRAPSAYDLVVIGGPVWAQHPATPVRAFLSSERSHLDNVAYFLTYGGSGGEQSLREMEELAVLKPVATLAVRQAEVKSGSFGPALAAFTSKLRASKAARTATAR